MPISGIADCCLGRLLKSQFFGEPERKVSCTPGGNHDAVGYGLPQFGWCGVAFLRDRGITGHSSAVFDIAIDWFRLREGGYVWVEPDDDGIVESDQFPGLRLDVPRMLARDLAAVLRALSPSPGPPGPAG